MIWNENYELLPGYTDEDMQQTSCSVNSGARMSDTEFYKKLGWLQTWWSLAHSTR